MPAFASLLRRSNLSRFSTSISTAYSSSSFSAQCFAQRTTSFSLPISPPPLPKKVPLALSAHGITRQDPYHWMRNTDDTDFLDFLQRENSYTQVFMADTHNLRSNLLSEMKNRMPTQISTPPELWGPWLYRQYTPGGKEYPVLCRSLGKIEKNWLSGLFRGEEGEEQVVLDWNQIAEKYGYVHVGVCRVSPDHNYLAYTVDITGGERFRLQIKDLRSDCLVSRLDIDGVVSLAWALDGKTLFYTVTDENQRPHRVVVTNVESDGTDDRVVYTERDSSFCVDITTTKDGKFVTINSNSRTSSEVYIVDADTPLAGLRRTRERVPGVQCFIEHHNGLFYILTNAPSPTKETTEGLSKGFYLTRCRVEEIEASDWQTVFYSDDDMTIQDMDMFNDYLVLFLNKKGLPMVCSIDMPIKASKKHMEDLSPWYFPLPADPCSVVPASNHYFQSSIYRLVLSSPVIPDTIVDYDVSRRSFSIVQQEGGYIDNSDSSTPWHSADCSTDSTRKLNDRTSQGQNGQTDSQKPLWGDFADAYICERQEISSYDGVEVPLTILYSREAWRKNQSPGLLIGYGAYGEALDKSWCSNRLSMLDRGWVIAFADVRGGGGGDYSWHKSGTGSLKLNSIQDFIYSAKYLIDEGYVHRHHLAAMAYSAGSILPAAAMNMHPTLFGAAILKVPFVDVLNSLSDPNLPLTLLDHEEFGNPDVQTDFQSILSYSPYDNIRSDVCYPPTLVTTSFHDSRVGVWEGAKWVAKIRESTCHDCSRAVLLQTNMNGGHFGEGGRYAQCEETAFDYAFLMKVMGHKDS